MQQSFDIVCPGADEIGVAMDARVHSTDIPIDPFADQPLRRAIDTSTSSVPAADQFGCYRSWFAGIVEIKLLRAERKSFPARHQAWQLRDMALSAIEVPGPGHDIRWEHLKRPLLDHWALSVPLSRSPAGSGESLGRSLIQMKCLELPTPRQAATTSS